MLMASLSFTFLTRDSRSADTAVVMYKTNGLAASPTNFFGANVLEAPVNGGVAVLKLDGVGRLTLSNRVQRLTNMLDVADVFAGLTGGDLLSYDSAMGLWTNKPAGSGEVNVNGEISKTNATVMGWVYDKAGVTNRLRSFRVGYGLASTNESTNLVAAVDPLVIAARADVLNLQGGTNGLRTDVLNLQAITNRNANQFGASATLTLKDYFYGTNFTDWATSRVASIIASNFAYVRAGQSESNAIVGGLLFKQIKIPAFTNLNTTIATFTNAGEFIVRGHTMTNSGDSVITTWRGKILAGTNSLRIVYGYETVLATGSFTNTATAFEAGMEVTRTASVGGHANAYVRLVQSVGALTSIPGGLIATNLTLSCTNGAHVTNVLQVASNRAGCVSNNYMRVYWEPASQ